MLFGIFGIDDLCVVCYFILCAKQQTACVVWYLLRCFKEWVSSSKFCCSNIL